MQILGTQYQYLTFFLPCTYLQGLATLHTHYYKQICSRKTIQKNINLLPSPDLYLIKKKWLTCILMPSSTGYDPNMALSLSSSQTSLLSLVYSSSFIEPADDPVSNSNFPCDNTRVRQLVFKVQEFGRRWKRNENLHQRSRLRKHNTTDFSLGEYNGSGLYWSRKQVCPSFGQSRNNFRPFFQATLLGHFITVSDFLLVQRNAH